MNGGLLNSCFLYFISISIRALYFSILLMDLQVPQVLQRHANRALRQMTVGGEETDQDDSSPGSSDGKNTSGDIAKHLSDLLKT